ncbi:TIGR00730 family Rossman fold protein [Eilatimonas milleporae]|uniref:Cytokinin riboside 5'-monophosphate phosphoribohydrolase n=1 Tax=Eilatimonas milleporae TaxID=911205 RepID=A0A3M0CGM7_9PROT|nr:TIGR00730 family Rossman fold protein [Eilatimonas milleporae]RMB08512.1 hypothetical protein BXY39_1147 [Eilatimonas milleporae]
MTQYPVKTVCVYCGSRHGTRPAYTTLAQTLGTQLAKEGFGLVYGAGSVGLMGEVARSATHAGARVVGIIPDHLDAVEITQEGLSETIVTTSMHERKKLMFDMSDAFLILPGGLGTLDETFEILTWRQLGLHKKPIILINEGGFWSPLIDLIDTVVTEGFAGHHHRDMLKVADTVDQAVTLLKGGAVDTGESASHLF